MNIGIDSNGHKHFYEINKIKEVDDISGTSLNRSFTYLSNNRLPSTQKNINSQPLQKYSIVNYHLNFHFLLLLIFCYVVKFLRVLKEFVNFRNFFHFSKIIFLYYTPIGSNDLLLL